MGKLFSKGNTMKYVSALFIAAVFLMSCGTDSQYNVKNYPDSIIIESFDRAGISPTSFAVRVSRALKYEIATGKYTKEQVVTFLNDWKSRVQIGVGYQVIGSMIEMYGKELLSNIGENVSEAANLAYILFMPDLSMFNAQSLIGPQDSEVVMAFIQYLLDNV